MQKRPIAYAFGSVNALTPLSGGGVAPVLGPYMPPTSAAKASIGAMRRVIADYNGPILELTKPVAGTTMDVYPSGGDWPNDTAVDAWAGAEIPVISKRYDQTGQGKHEVMFSLATAPTYSSKVVDADGHRLACFDDYVNGAGTHFPKYLVGPSGLSLSRQNFGLHLVIDPRWSSKDSPFYEFSNGATAEFTLYQATADNGVSVGQSGAFRKSSKRLRCRPQSLGYRGNASNASIFVNGVKSDQIQAAAITIGTTVKDAGAIAANFYSNHASHCTTVFSTAPSDGDLSAMDAWAALAFNFPTTNTATKVLAYGGSSLIQGQCVTFLQTPLSYMHLGEDWEAYNFGISGQSLATQRTNFALKEGSVYNAAKPCVLFTDAPSNDIQGATYTGVSDAQTQVDAYWTAQMQPFIDAAIAAGWHGIVVPTIIPRGVWNETTNYKESARLYWNNKVRAVTGPVKPSDRVSAPELATITSTYFETDNTHLKDAGQLIMAAIDKAAILAAAA